MEFKGREKIAILFDLENLSPEDILPNLLNKFNSRGFNVHPRKLILNNISQIRKSFLDKNVKLYHLDLVCAYAPIGKNSADFRLYIEALDLLYKNPEIKYFCIVSGDSDYAELVIKLKNENRFVIGVGPQEKIKEEYVTLFDEFIYTADLKQIEKEVKIEKPVENKKKVKKVPTKKEKASKPVVETKKKEVVEVKKQQPSKKPTYLRKSKNGAYYIALSQISNIILNEKEESGLKEIFCSTFIKDIKERSPDYLGSYKVTYKDLQKIGYDILIKEEGKPETSFIKLSSDK